MLRYATVGTDNMPQATEFYDRILTPLGGRRAYSWLDKMQFYTCDDGGMFCVCRPHDGGPASAGNGSMFPFQAATPELVDQVHAIALAAGGCCEGEPGPRVPSIRIAYFRDLDGNKLAVYHMGSVEQLAAEAGELERQFLALAEGPGEEVEHTGAN